MTSVFRPSALFPAAIAAALSAAVPARGGLLYQPDAYVQDGLVVQLDGICNAGALAHDSAATSWANLADSANPAMLLSYTGGSKNASGAGGWRDDAFCLDGDFYFQTANAVKGTECATVEVFGDFAVPQPTQYPNYASKVSSNDCGIWMNGGALKWKINVDGLGFSDRPEIASWDRRGFAAVLSATNCVLYASGAVGTKTVARAASHSVFSDSKWNVGCNYQAKDHPAKGTCHAVRIYTNALTAAQVAANWRLDQWRFVTGIPTTNAVVASSCAGVSGTQPSGAYAVDADGFAFTAPASVSHAGATYALAGYTLAEWDETAGDWGAPVSYDGESSCAVSASQKVRIEWQWDGPPQIASASLAGTAAGLSAAFEMGGSPATSLAVVDATGATLGTAGAAAAGASGSIALSPFSDTRELALIASNSAGETTNALGVACGGAISATAVSDAREADLSPAVVRFSRPSADPFPIAVNFAVSDGTAAADTDYLSPASGTVVIAAGETSADLAIAPFFNADKTSDTSFAVSLAPGLYPASGASATVTIRNAATLSVVYACDDFGGYPAGASVSGQAPAKRGFLPSDAWAEAYPAPVKAQAVDLGFPEFVIRTNTAGSIARVSGSGYSTSAKRALADVAIPRSGSFCYRFVFNQSSLADGRTWCNKSDWNHGGNTLGLSATSSSTSQDFYQIWNNEMHVGAGPMPNDGNNAIGIYLRTGWSRRTELVAPADYACDVDWLVCVETTLSDSGNETFRAFAIKVADATRRNLRHPAWVDCSACAADLATPAAPLRFLTLATHAGTDNAGTTAFDEFRLGATLDDVFPTIPNATVIVVR